MPKTTDPSGIQAGTGRTEPTRSNYQVNGSGTGTLVAPADTKNDYGVKEGTLSPINSHVDDTQDAHAASAIQIDQKPDDIFTSQNVEGALDELSALIPPPTPTLGNYKNYQDVMGIPDWGVFKLKDASLTSRDSSAFIQSNPPGETYPYYWIPSHPAIEYKPFEPDGTIVYPTTNWNEGGNDPENDLTFNIWDGGYQGGGPGWCHAGAFTEAGGDIISTMRVYPYDGNVPLGLIARGVVVSGVVYPADKGVLAIFFWPADGNLAAFLAQPLTTRCKAAILLGQGIYGCTDGCPRDGEPGGIFLKGEDSAGDYDPYEWPGQATGQASLEEIYTGVSEATSSPFPGPPYLNFDGLTSPGCQTVDYPALGGIPFPGQVRLGTDPDASAASVVSNGIPILGAIAAARGLGNDNNFFRYRLPYLDDYSSTSGGGLKYTPVGERPRYYSKPTISLNPTADLTQAGDYTNYEKTYWPMQVARYRHRFAIEAPLATPSTAGSYFMVHFRKEEYFEDFTLAGTISAARIYSVNAADWTNMENPLNVTGTAGWPAVNEPAEFYHAIRSDIYAEDVAAYNDPVAVPGAAYTLAPIVQDDTMFASGIQYFMPLGWTGNPSLQMLTCGAQASGVFGVGLSRNAYLFGIPTGATWMYSMNPGTMAVGCLTGATNIVPTYSLGGVMRQRVEMPIYSTAPGSMNEGAFSITGGPVPADNAWISLGATTVTGDTDPCAFSTDVQPVAIWRRPLQQEQTALCIGLTTSIPEAAANTILYHGTVDPAFGIPLYGNLTLAGGVGTQGAPGPALPSLESPDKDTTERFLDEVYRYDNTWTGSVTAQAALYSGTPGGVNVEVPARAGTSLSLGGYNWTQCSYLQSMTYPNSMYAEDLVAVLTSEAQVAGLPHRNPPVTDGVYTPYPNSGRLMYPQTNYAVAHRPSQADGDIAVVQLDYSVCAGARDYVRCFDTAFSRSVDPLKPVVASQDQPYFTLRIDGLGLSDFEYSGGPNANIVIYAKVPGITAWLDIGRTAPTVPNVETTSITNPVVITTVEDHGLTTGDAVELVGTDNLNLIAIWTATVTGPKTFTVVYDATLDAVGGQSGTVILHEDGKGGKVVGATTFQGYDTQTGIIYSQVYITMTNNLFRSVGHPTVANEVPILIKVNLKDTVAAHKYDFEHQYPGWAGPDPTISCRLIRGIAGIRIVHPDE